MAPLVADSIDDSPSMSSISPPKKHVTLSNTLLVHTFERNTTQSSSNSSSSSTWLARADYIHMRQRDSLLLQLAGMRADNNNNNNSTTTTTTAQHSHSWRGLESTWTKKGLVRDSRRAVLQAYHTHPTRDLCSIYQQAGSLQAAQDARQRGIDYQDNNDNNDDETELLATLIASLVTKRDNDPHVNKDIKLAVYVQRMMMMRKSTAKAVHTKVLPEMQALDDISAASILPKRKPTTPPPPQKSIHKKASMPLLSTPPLLVEPPGLSITPLSTTTTTTTKTVDAAKSVLGIALAVTTTKPNLRSRLVASVSMRSIHLQQSPMKSSSSSSRRRRFSLSNVVSSSSAYCHHRLCLPTTNNNNNKTTTTTTMTTTTGGGGGPWNELLHRPSLSTRPSNMGSSSSGNTTTTINNNKTKKKKKRFGFWRKSITTICSDVVVNDPMAFHGRRPTRHRSGGGLLLSGFQPIRRCHRCLRNVETSWGDVECM